MFGLIWFVQVVHYPLFGNVGTSGYTTYQAEHQRRTTFVVLPLMLVEIVTSVVIAWKVVTAGDSRPLDVAVALVGVTLVGIIWATTFLVSVPRHNVLARGYDARAHATLVATNWIRTASWTLRCGVALWMAGNW